MTVENNNAKVKNLIEKVKSEVVENATYEIFEEMLNLESINQLSENISDSITHDLLHAGIMSNDIRLDEKQKERLSQSMPKIISKAKSEYLDKIKKKERVRDIANLVERNLQKIIEEMLSSLAKEVNRGALINALAVSADCKSEKCNKIELNYSKSAGDITIPTRCLLISTNCLDIVKDSTEIEIEEENEDEELREAA